MTHNFLDRPPEDRNHLADIVCLAAHIRLLVLEMTLLLYAFFSQLFAADADGFFGVISLFLVLAVEVLLHPAHLLEEELQVGAARGRHRLHGLFWRELAFGGGLQSARNEV